MRSPASRQAPTGSIDWVTVWRASDPSVTVTLTPPPPPGAVTVPPSDPDAAPSVAATPVSCWPGLRVRLSVAGACPSAVTTTVKVPGVGRPRRVKAPTSSWVSDTVRAVVSPKVAVTVAPPIGPPAPVTCPAIDPSPSSSWISRSARVSPAARSMRWTCSLKPGLVTTRSYTAGEGICSSANSPSPPTGTVRTTAPGTRGPPAGPVRPPARRPAPPPEPGVPAPPAATSAAGTCPASAGESSGSSSRAVAPATSAPTTVPDTVAGTPPSRTVRPSTAPPAGTSMGAASASVAAAGYQTSAKPAPRRRSLKVPAGRSVTAHAPASSEAVVVSGAEVSASSKTSTDTPTSGSPVEMSSTWPDMPDVPDVAAPVARLGHLQGQVPVGGRAGDDAVQRHGDDDREHGDRGDQPGQGDQAAGEHGPLQEHAHRRGRRVGDRGGRGGRGGGALGGAELAAPAG